MAGLLCIAFFLPLRDQEIISIFFHQKRSASCDLFCGGWPALRGHWMFPYAYENHVRICGGGYVVEKYVSLSYSFVKFEIGSVFLDGSPYPSDERTAKVGKTGIQTNVNFCEPTFSPKNILA